MKESFKEKWLVASILILVAFVTLNLYLFWIVNRVEVVDAIFFKNGISEEQD